MHERIIFLVSWILSGNLLSWMRRLYDGRMSVTLFIHSAVSFSALPCSELMLYQFHKNLLGQAIAERIPIEVGRNHDLTFVLVGNDFDRIADSNTHRQ